MFPTKEEKLDSLKKHAQKLDKENISLKYAIWKIYEIAKEEDNKIIINICEEVSGGRNKEERK